MNRSSQGLTLIEIIVSFGLLSIVLLAMFTTSLFFITQSRSQADAFMKEQNMRMAMDAIEKRLREMNTRHLIYQPSQQTFKSQMEHPEGKGQITVWIDFSGKNRNRLNTWLYYDESTGTLRVSRNREHNILHLGIGGVTVSELIPGSLIKIALTSECGGKRQEMILRLSYGRDES